MRRLAGLVLTILLVLGGCTGDSSTPTYELKEFSIDGPGHVSEGTESLEVSNSGEFPHTLVVTDSSGEVIAATGLIQPGETSSLEVALDEGRYSFTCRIVVQDEEGAIIDHFEAGMNETVSVTG